MKLEAGLLLYTQELEDCSIWIRLTVHLV